LLRLARQAELVLAPGANQAASDKFLGQFELRAAGRAADFDCHARPLDRATAPNRVLAGR
jgi:hypothetical protein